MTTTTVTTRRGIETEVLVAGPESGAPVVFFHGFVGPLGGEPMLGVLAAAGMRVHAPVWPGYSEASTETAIEDMLDFALHGADVVEALGLGLAHGAPRPLLIGHSMGGMIAGEMAALSPESYSRLVLISPLGLWVDASPVPDIFSLLPFEFPPMLFTDVGKGIELLAGGGLDFDDVEAIKRFLIGNSRRLGTAGKILFPIPNRRLSKRLYRVTNPTLLVWGDGDRLLGDAYAAAWSAAISGSQLVTIAGAGHMAPYEKPDEVAQAISEFLSPEATMSDDDLRARRDAVIREHMRSENEREFDSTIGTFRAPKYELIPTGHVIEGEEAVRRYYRASRELVPDQRNELITLHHTDDAAIVEFWLRGTYQGSVEDAPPSGRAFECRMCAIFEFEPGADGIVSERVYWDQHTIRAQLMGDIAPLTYDASTQ